MKMMSLASRRELLASIREKYKNANWLEKGKLLDGFAASSGYRRKYAIQLLSRNPGEFKAKPKRCVKVRYDEAVRLSLLQVWFAANQICSKRLVPFLPDLVEAMERHGHLSLPADVRERLLGISRSSVDRLLKIERGRTGLASNTTRPGNLLKHQIQVRTFADWNDVVPGFLEADLVAHCGGHVQGSFLNTLVLIDISTGWLECMPLLRKSAADVMGGLQVAEDLLPFKILGLDTDNGGEFINYEMLEYCETKQITFTRSRSYKKNDQAHVEEKNGSVVRRLVGYDRFEGERAWQALAELYRVLRVYVNFFQPSLKLLEKSRSGAKVTKKYDTAKTPYQRVLLSEHISQLVKDSLGKQYQALDPVGLIEKLKRLQDTLWTYSWNVKGPEISSIDLTPVDDSNLESKGDVKLNSPSNLSADDREPERRLYRRKGKIDLRKASRTWRTRKDPFEDVWDELQLRLEIAPENTAKDLLSGLIERSPGQFKRGQLRTLQRKVAKWRSQQKTQSEKMRAIMHTPLETAMPLS